MSTSEATNTERDAACADASFVAAQLQTALSALGAVKTFMACRAVITGIVQAHVDLAGETADVASDVVDELAGGYVPATAVNRPSAPTAPVWPFHTSGTQTLLRIDATYDQVVAAFGHPKEGGGTDKSRHEWLVTIGGVAVGIYDYDRDCGSTDPATSPGAQVTWHVNATGPGHADAAWKVAGLIGDSVTLDVAQELHRRWTSDKGEIAP